MVLAPCRLVDATHATRGRRGHGGGPASRRYTVSSRSRGDVGLAMTRSSRTYPSATWSLGSESRKSSWPRSERNLNVGIGLEGNVVLWSIVVG